MRLPALTMSAVILTSALQTSASEIDLRDASLDYTYIILAHDSLLAAIQPLKEHRENDYCGNFSNVYSVAAIAKSTVEAQFGAGASGIKDFLTYAYNNWAARPEYVLLVGDGDYVEAFGDTLIPTYSCQGMDLKDFRTDDWFGCFDGPLDFVPEVIIARLPARTAAEVEAYVDKVIAYDLGAISRAANDNFLFLCQDRFAQMYPDQIRAVRDDLTANFLCQDWNVATLTASEISGEHYPDCYADWEAAALAKLNASPNGEAAIVVGGIASASGVSNFMKFLDINQGFDMSKVTALGVMPLFVGTSCAQGAFVMGPGGEPSVRTIADVLLFEPYKGAIGLIGPTFGTRLHGNYWFAQALYPRLRNHDKTVGKAFLEAKIECLESYQLEQSTFREYSLLGDPALVLAGNYEPDVTGIFGRGTVDPGDVEPLEVFFEDRNHTCCGGGGFCDEIWSIDWEAELGTVAEDEGWPVVPHTATYHAPEGVSGVYDHVTVTVTDKMGLIGIGTKSIYIRHSKPGCPYLYVYDGESFRRDNNISGWAHSDGPGRKASFDYYKLRIAPAGNEYLMEIRGLEKETSYLDKVSLLVIDHEESTSIGVTTGGSPFQYQALRPPIAAVDQEGEDRQAAVCARDSLSFKGRKGDFILLTFDVDGPQAGLASDAAGGDGGGVILGGDGKVDPCEDGGCYGGDVFAEEVPEQGAQPMSIPRGILVQIEDSDGAWTDVSFMRPREHQSEVVVPSSAFGSGGRVPGRVRLFWTGEHTLDYVGLVNKEAEVLVTQRLEPAAAVHSVDGSVLDNLTGRDDRETSIDPGEKISLTFVPNPLEAARRRDLVLVTGGYFTREPDLITSAQMSIVTRDDLELVTPNPFNAEVAIHYAVAAPGHVVTIAVFDVKGRLVKTLFHGAESTGRYVTGWDGRTGTGREAPAGVYFCRMIAGRQKSTRKIVKGR